MKTSHRQEKKSYFDILMLCTIIAVLAIWYYWPHSTTTDALSQRETIQKLHVVRPLAQDITITTNFIGYVTPIDSVEIVPYISGFIDEANVKGGEHIKAGEQLFLIRQDEYKAKLDAAKANILKAQAELNNADVYYKRMSKAGTKIISPTELDNAKASFLSAQASLSQAKADKELAQVNYNYTHIKAPISGIVGDVKPRMGDYVSPATGTLLTIISFDPIWVVFSITDKEYLEQISLGYEGIFGGEEIQLRLANGQIYPHIGTFSYIDNQINQGTSSISVYAQFPNPDRQLVPNAYVDVMLDKNYQNIVQIPQNLVQLEEKNAYAYVVKNNILERKVVNILGLHKNNYVVENNFTPDTYLVNEQIGHAQTGNKVEIILPLKQAKEDKH